MGEEAPPPAEAAQTAEPPPATPLSRGDVSRGPRLFTHWKRPTFLQYGYIYDYRHNYYNDVINYLDQRSRGYKPDIPRPQTWAERSLRTYSDRYRTQSNFFTSKDAELLHSIRASENNYRYNVRRYSEKRFSSFIL